MNPRSDGFSVKVKPVVKPASTMVYVEAGLSEGYKREPVPKHARKSLFTVSAVWIGFPMVVTSVVVAGIIVCNLGFVTGTMAIPVGKCSPDSYVGTLSHMAGNAGKNFALTAADTFGATALTYLPGRAAAVDARPALSGGST